jgi:hypothetical protein
MNKQTSRDSEKIERLTRAEIAKQKSVIAADQRQIAVERQKLYARVAQAPVQLCTPTSAQRSSTRDMS